MLPSWRQDTCVGFPGDPVSLRAAAEPKDGGYLYKTQSLDTWCQKLCPSGIDDTAGTIPVASQARRSDREAENPCIRFSRPRIRFGKELAQHLLRSLSGEFEDDLEVL